MVESIATKPRPRKARHTSPQVAPSDSSIVCTSIRCDHPKRRYSCSTSVKYKLADGSTRSYTVPHVDCVHAGVGDKCAACCVGKAAR